MYRKADALLEGHIKAFKLSPWARVLADVFQESREAILALQCRLNAACLAMQARFFILAKSCHNAFP